MDLNKKKELIEMAKHKKLTDIQLYQLFCMIKEDTDKYTQNNNGILVNLKRLRSDTIEKMYFFLKKSIETNDINIVQNQQTGVENDLSDSSEIESEYSDDPSELLQ